MIDAFKRHKMIVILILVLVGIGIWYITSSSGTPEPTLTNAGDSLQGEDQELVQTLLRLRSITLDGAIFQNPIFVNLKDFTVQIQPEPVGRPDPFARLSGGSAATSQSTQSATIFRTQH
jgi:hypothetical protein